MTANGPYANASSWVAIAPETTRGTAADTPTLWIPAKSPVITPTITELPDEGLRGSMVTTYDQVPGVRHDEYSFTTSAYLDTLPALMKALLGSSDTVSGSAAPYTHKIGLLNNAPTTGNQPPSYTFFDYDGYLVRSLPGGQVDSISIKFTATGLVELTVKVLALAYTTTDTVPSTTFSTVAPAPAWSCTASVNSTSNTRIVDGSLDLKRNVKPINTLGTQAPLQLWAGPLDVSGQLTVINATDAEQTLYLNGTSFPLSLEFTSPVTAGESFTFTMSAVKAKSAHQERGNDGVITTVMDLLPLPNTTDAAAGGIAPVSFTAVNAQETAY